MPTSVSQTEAAPRRKVGMRYPTADKKLLNRRDRAGALTSSPDRTIIIRTILAG
jgi:hypothetical protein